MKEIYLDNSATTGVVKAVADKVYQVMTEDYGNPSSMHRKGLEAEKYLNEAKQILAGILKVPEKELLFTSGGTESDNTALIGCALANQRAGKHLITSSIEHPAILETMAYLEEQGFEVTYLPVDPAGRVRLDDLKAALRPDTILVSIMHVNNEIGSIQPIEEIGAYLKSLDHKVLFHVDAVQSFGRFRIYPKRAGIDLLSVSAHKLHGPKGVGFLYIDSKVKIKPIVFGGGQQKGMRSGTENVPGIAGMAEAARLCYLDFDEKNENLYALKEHFTEEVLKIEGTTLNGLPGKESAPHVVSISFADVRAEVLLHALEDRGIYVSSGSACATNHPSISATLKGIGVKKELLDATIRFSFSTDTTAEELDETVKVLQEILPMLRRFTRR